MWRYPGNCLSGTWQLGPVTLLAEIGSRKLILTSSYPSDFSDQAPKHKRRVEDDFSLGTAMFGSLLNYSGLPVPQFSTIARRTAQPGTPVYLPTSTSKSMVANRIPSSCPLLLPKVSHGQQYPHLSFVAMADFSIVSAPCAACEAAYCGRSALRLRRLRRWLSKDLPIRVWPYWAIYGHITN